MTAERLIIEITRAEALVLLDLLARWNDESVKAELKGGVMQDYLRIEHRAEAFVLWRVQGQLEKQMVEMFDPRYKELVEEAGREVIGENDMA